MVPYSTFHTLCMKRSFFLKFIFSFIIKKKKKRVTHGASSPGKSNASTVQLRIAALLLCQNGN